MRAQSRAPVFARRHGEGDVQGRLWAHPERDGAPDFPAKLAGLHAFLHMWRSEYELLLGTDGDTYVRLKVVDLTEDDD